VRGLAADSDAVVPSREEWPEPPPRTEAGDALTDVIVATFQLDGRLMDVARRLARAGGITATEWRVLGGVLGEPHSVAEIARLMGMTRQGVQRVADELVDRGLAEYRPNPAHRRAKLLACTEAGHWAIRQIALVQRPWADRIGAQVGTAELRKTLTTIRKLLSALDADEATRAVGVRSGARHRRRAARVRAGGRVNLQHEARLDQ
jgi:DNA-binding MarR family transcriptional regulator